MPLSKNTINMIREEMVILRKRLLDLNIEQKSKSEKLRTIDNEIYSIKKRIKELKDDISD